MAQLMTSSDGKTKPHANNVVNKVFINRRNLATGQFKHFTFFPIWRQNCRMNIHVNGLQELMSKKLFLHNPLKQCEYGIISKMK